MSRIRIIWLATGLSVATMLLASATRAQAPGGRGGPGGSGGGFGEGSSLSLVVIPAVQDELELTKAQKTKIETLKAEVDKKTGPIWATLPPPPKQNKNDGGFGDPGGYFAAYGILARTRPFQVALEQLQEIEGEVDTALRRILKPPQAKRLLQIKLQSQFQRQGMSIFASHEVASQLHLSGEQVAQIREILRQGRQRAGVARTRIDPKNPPPDPSKFQKQDGGLDFKAWWNARNSPEAKAQSEQIAKEVEEIRDQTHQQITKVLTKTQLSNFKKLLGAPFDLAKLAKSSAGGR
jgi:hypothetical protein